MVCTGNDWPDFDNGEACRSVLDTGLVTRVTMCSDATYPDGTVVSSVLGPDPRWGMRAPVVTSATVTMPGGKVQTTTTQRSATLGSPGDVLSLRTFTETTTVNGRAITSVYSAASRTFTRTSPTGRRYTAILDDQGQLVHEQLGDLAPTSYTYDLRGRHATVTEGVGAGSRVTRLGEYLPGVDSSRSKRKRTLRHWLGHSTIWSLSSPD